MTHPAKRQKTSDPLTVLYQDQQIINLAKARDNSRCVLTGAALIEVGYIYPHSLIKYQEEDKLGPRHNFWNYLKNFWSKEKVATWEAEIFPGGICEIGVDTVHNVIALSLEARTLWDRGAFALKPISESDDKKTLELQFFWQEIQTDLQQTMSLLTTPISTKGLDRNTGIFGGTIRLFRTVDGRKIQSGDIFKLHTDDPEAKPLPSFKLLELLWFLKRVQGMAGSADIDWRSYSDSDSEYEEECRT